MRNAYPQGFPFSRAADAEERRHTNKPAATAQTRAVGSKPVLRQRVYFHSALLD